ncbi:MAG: TetR/AcrR family transcriptional regulator [Xanthobacteraceae bacterium]|nr:TetR/AcrR family transcriptional regulator [Xanthobacteraceae bacterium]
MVQKERKRRGRPPAYVPEVALARATKAFWESGFAATSLDDLAAATGMNRPSLYGAFGDKHALYLRALAAYWDAGRSGMADALAPDRPLREGLRRVYSIALDLYFPLNGQPRGCFLIGTATTEAMRDADVRATLAEALREIDAAFEARLLLAKERGELTGAADPWLLAMLAAATLHTLALRSRAGASRADLEKVADGAVAFICAAGLAAS